ncbi:transposase [Streptomyces sp. NPDC056944]|uniref:transposase n=1 Tax=Streptomyces sp. NPDC056944 TaxID=3345972 RepID=UPI003639B8CF
MRTGVQWHDLPKWFDPRKTVHERHRMWSADGTWEHRMKHSPAVATRYDKRGCDFLGTAMAVRLVIWLRT